LYEEFANTENFILSFLITLYFNKTSIPLFVNSPLFPATEYPVPTVAELGIELNKLDVVFSI
jgi:hypothetical protein